MIATNKTSGTQKAAYRKVDLIPLDTIQQQKAENALITINKGWLIIIERTIADTKNINTITG